MDMTNAIRASISLERQAQVLWLLPGDAGDLLVTQPILVVATRTGLGV
jgi:hypothetical protein